VEKSRKGTGFHTFGLGHQGRFDPQGQCSICRNVADIGVVRGPTTALVKPNTIVCSKGARALIQSSYSVNASPAIATKHHSDPNITALISMGIWGTASLSISSLRANMVARVASSLAHPSRGRFFASHNNAFHHFLPALYGPVDGGST
jgi:hypothetical protein